MSIYASEGRVTKRRKTGHESSDEHSDQDQRTAVNSRRRSEADNQSRNTDRIRSKSIAGASSVQMISGNGSLSTQANRSTLMAAQAKELVARTSFNEGRLRSFQETIDTIIGVIKSIPDRSPSTLVQVEKVLGKQGTLIPFGKHRPSPDVKYSFPFSRIEEVHVRGFMSTGIASADHKAIEMAIEMPKSAFHEKDFLNYRAFHKRAFYVACIACALSASMKTSHKLQYEWKDGNTLLPIIRLVPSSSNNNEEEPEVLINVLLNHEVGPISKLLPSKNCVRVASDERTSPVGDLAPTPFYNSTLRLNASTLKLDRLTEESSRNCEAFRDACILGKTWLHQRGFTSSIAEGGFGSEEWNLLTALLLTSGGQHGMPLFSSKYTSIQLFKAMLQVLSGRDLIEKPLVIGGIIPGLRDLKHPMVFDMTHGVNILHNMSSWSYNTLKHVASLSLAAMNARNQNNFDATFILRSSDKFLQFDETFEIEIPNQVINGNEGIRPWLAKLYSILKRGLNDRTLLVDLQIPRSESWNLGDSGPQIKQNRVQIRLVVNPNVADRTLDHGPSAEEQQEAEQFRIFWGEKSELRRFRDGRITETLVWSDKTPVTFQIIEYLVGLHLGISTVSLKKSPQQIASTILDDHASNSATAAFRIINTKYQELASRLHQLEGLPLPIRSVSPSNPSLRSAAIRNPLIHNTTSPIDILIQFDSSARWPDHLPAIQYTKIAFLTKLADLLSVADPSCATRVGIENTAESITGMMNTSFLDIIQPAPAPGLSALIFRVRIHHDRETHLLQAQLSSKTTTSATKEVLTSALATLKRDFVASPVHTTGIRNLITHFVPLSATIRLLKHWFAAHHLTNHIPEPIIEIIAAYVFLHPYPWSAPGTASTGFLRCLHFLSRWDWTATPLIVDLSLTRDMSTSTYSELETRFLAWRKLDPAMNNVSWFVGTSIDTTGTIWTQGSRPPRVIGTRVSALARASIDHIRSQDLVNESINWNALFESGVEEFDFVVRLKPTLVKGAKNDHKRKANSSFKNLIVQEEMDVDKIGHDVVQLYLSDLERIFGSTVLFFHGYGDPVIAGLWRPNVNGLKEWRVRLGYSSLPVASRSSDDADKEVMCKINKEGIITEIAQLGSGMIERIDVR